MKYLLILEKQKASIAIYIKEFYIYWTFLEKLWEGKYYGEVTLKLSPISAKMKKIWSLS